MKKCISKLVRLFIITVQNNKSPDNYSPYGRAKEGGSIGDSYWFYDCVSPQLFTLKGCIFMKHLRKQTFSQKTIFLLFFRSLTLKVIGFAKYMYQKVVTGIH